MSPPPIGSARIAQYREMQRSIPGVDGLYAAASAVLDAYVPRRGSVLVVGAGGCRELETFGANRPDLRLVAIDTSPERIADAERHMAQCAPEIPIRYVAGGIEAVPTDTPFHGASSLLVMHAIPDDGAKGRYLRGIRDRLVAGAPLVLADVSVETPAEFERSVPAFLCHARTAGVAARLAEVDPHVVPGMPVIGEGRTRELLAQAGFGDVTPFFRSFWYAGWWARAV